VRVGVLPGDAVAPAQLVEEQKAAVEPAVRLLDLVELGELTDGLVGGSLSSEQRTPLTHTPCSVAERPWRLYSARRTWATALPPNATTWKASKHTRAWGTPLSARIAFS